MIDLAKVVERRTQVLEAIVADARMDPRMRSLLLVGSLAKENNDAYSDIDLVLIAEADSVDALLADRFAFPAQFGEVVLQLDSSWNMWRGAAQILTLLDGDLPLWIDMDIWPPSVAGTPSDARVLVGSAAEPVASTLSELTRELKERHGPGQIGSDNVPRVLDVAGLAWRLKGIARGAGAPLSDVEEALDESWPPELERAREPLRRFAEHVASKINS